MLITDLDRARTLRDHRSRLQREIAAIERGSGIVIKIGGDYASRDVVDAATGPVLESLRSKREAVDTELVSLGIQLSA